MSSAALLSCLGVRGWGPLHWWLRRDGEPDALLARLRRAWRLVAAGGAADPRASLLLAGLVHSSTDLIPLIGAVPPPRSGGAAYRHRLVCRPAERWLYLRSWESPFEDAPWRGCGLERCLDAALLSDRAGPDAAGLAAVWVPQPRLLVCRAGRLP